MAIAFVGAVTASDAASGNVLTTSAYTVSAGSLLVAVWRHYHDNVSGKGTPTITISDSKSNTWSNVNSETFGAAGVGDGIRWGISYAMNAAAGSTTFTFTINSNNWTSRALTILEYSGAAISSALSGQGSGKASAGTVTTSTFSTTGNTVSVIAATTFNGANINDWTSSSVASNATNSRANTDTAILIRDYISTSSFTNVTSAATNANGSISKGILSASFLEATAATTIYEFQSLNRGVGRGIARGIA